MSFEDCSNHKRFGRLHRLFQLLCWEEARSVLQSRSENCLIPEKMQSTMTVRFFSTRRFLFLIN